jgi:hypothetical protein
MRGTDGGEPFVFGFASDCTEGGVFAVDQEPAASPSAPGFDRPMDARPTKNSARAVALKRSRTHDYAAMGSSSTEEPLPTSS